ncbi:hypothetical protein FOMPIDRAFT_1049540 [Fomitopsis schrenkii]|uniref:Uncharacterized protein n=1 Tax=Fomitopsis schrenkii TaxID=2126942 RepID=S8FGE7_FOMSC|nr:hypothetical protein FOMPIDRAFT_1049540 [Fomitopsis schrenkii]
MVCKASSNRQRGAYLILSLSSSAFSAFSSSSSSSLRPPSHKPALLAELQDLASPSEPGSARPQPPDPPPKSPPRPLAAHKQSNTLRVDSLLREGPESSKDGVADEAGRWVQRVLVARLADTLVSKTGCPPMVSQYDAPSYLINKKIDLTRCSFLPLLFFFISGYTETWPVFV